MSAGLVQAAYIVAAVFFVISLAGLSKQESARSANYYGIAGMAIALIATIFSPQSQDVIWIVLAMSIGGSIGVRYTRKVEMAKMPELVAILHSFVGMAAVLVGYNSYIDLPQNISHSEHTIHLIEVFIGIFIGAVTFTGSVVAFCKLQGTLSSLPLSIRHKHKWNCAALIISMFLLFHFLERNGSMISLGIMTLIAFLFGYHLVASIGGADMPVVVSMLNSYSGWAAAATGFMLANDLLIITGALVGSSGAILSYIMCKAMNRSFINVLIGGLEQKTRASTSSEKQGEYYEINAKEVAEILKSSKSIIITPGYGMAVAQAQYLIYEITEKLQARGVNIRFAIHPVAGRLPGHMNVLLAEAKLPYNIILEMDEINSDFSKTDVVLVVGANDIVNPAALENPDSPIAGMPVLEVWNAKNVIVFKRSMNTGYAGIQNPLFFKKNTQMLFGDAKDNVEIISKAL
ncbi:NAD(P) transhydrogenase subunit beta [Candidatus Photodesmus blepharus]|uniref:NAD(P) transhydrogenase subunit beta n=1 Tax=Candidatus Photodesmus blepharonis TaxID=1179155 RepID=A0A084CNA1_9GAMM|nr:Re/Si-specific NAD(P)(+) transhydrogenase subunit beta [Candidatus Photodesmus blepharus]KEY91280.1 NAD(P) transhydrogenase subunit beta [Candidatus Photodesmus blepharus]